MLNVCSFFATSIDGAIFSFCDFEGCKYQSSYLQPKFDAYVAYQKTYGMSTYTTNSYLKAALFLFVLVLGALSYVFFEKTCCFLLRFLRKKILIISFFMSFLCLYFSPFLVVFLVHPTSFPLYFMLSSNSQIFVILVFFVFLSCLFPTVFHNKDKTMTRKQRALFGKVLRSQEVGFYEIGI